MTAAGEGDLIRAILGEAADAHRRFADRGVRHVTEAAAAILAALSGGHSVIAFGNGGSAGDAQHLVTELVGRFEGDRRALAAVALTADTSVVTALANDYGYDQVFVRQLEAIGRPGDVALGISTSGQSRNVELALWAARSRGLTAIALTGTNGGRVGAAADIHVNVAETSTARAQEVHRTILHAICALVDRGITSTE